MRRLVIAIDCDDVLVSTADKVLSHYNHRYGTSIGLADYYSTVESGVWGTDDRSVAISRVQAYTLSPEYAAIQPDQAAIAAVRTLSRSHELHLVTGRVSELERVTREMVERSFADCFTSIQHTNYVVHDTSKTRSKGEVCAELGAHLLIDDHVTHAQSVLASGIEEVIVFGDYPWNKGLHTARMKKSTDWSEVLAEVDRIAGR